MKKISVFFLLCLPLLSIAQQTQDVSSADFEINENQSLLLFHLKTKYNDHGITYRYVPIQFHHHSINWNEVDTAYVRSYRWFREYGGRGIRLSFKNGKCINAKGDEGLQLILKDGDKFLIGTERPEELKAFIKELLEKGILHS